MLIKASQINLNKNTRHCMIFSVTSCKLKNLLLKVQYSQTDLNNSTEQPLKTDIQ